MKKVIVIVGPTGVGKTSLSVKLAKHYNTEIISGDSVQVYRSLDIGSGKVTKEETENIKHHLIDILDPTDDYSASDFQANARKIIDILTNKNKLPIICGGTGYYIKAALYDYEFLDEKRSNKYDNLTNEEIYNKLLELNDSTIPDIHNRARLLRHLEILSTREEPKNKDVPLYDALFIGLTCDRDKLYERINIRVDKMIEDGLVQEVKTLYDKNIRSKSVDSIGYKELYQFFDNRLMFDDAVALIKQHSRNFAKRQYTFFKNQLQVSWIDIEKEDPLSKAISLIDEFIKS
ncbi:tRNA (adenosine(37)-N6)-dimethylallyltransferase MiaA [bacterium]|nr:tRNA (adenosine(37)-N6)-dimethylallyltransferase MiaA [bacterium]